jgi:putative ABC transport system substrate-binding protein
MSTSRSNRVGMRLLSPLLVALLLSPIAGRAEDKPLNIGVLALGPRNMPTWQCGPAAEDKAAAANERNTKPFYVLGLIDELHRLKYVENRPENAGKPGRRFNLDLRMGTLSELKTFARAFADRPVDIIVAISTSVVRVAQSETRERPIPILFPGISDPVGDGFVQSLARPGGFITGVSHQQVQGSGKRVELFKQMIPSLQRLITLRRPQYGPAEHSMSEIRATAARLNIDVLDSTASSLDEFKTILAKVTRDTADGIMIVPDTFIFANLDKIIERSLAQRVPTFGTQDFMADWGALAAYGPSAYQAGEHLARYIDKISKGARPGDLPVEPIDPTFVVNLKTAGCLGLSLPLAVLQQADRIIR